MLISSKHNQVTINRTDFTGGLNTSTAEEMIADNEFSLVENMELDSTTGLLKTVAGTKTLFSAESKTFTKIIYDTINSLFLLCDSDRKVNKLDSKALTLTEIGELSGPSIPNFETWEDGVLLASSGKLQYYNGSSLITIQNGFSDDLQYWKESTVCPYESDHLYKVNEIVINSEKYFLCKSEHTSVDLETDKDNWIELDFLGWNFTTQYKANNLICINDIYYLCKENHTSITDSPDVCNGVYIRSGRVLVYYDNSVRYSAVGDETNWSENNNDASASKFIEAGYKDGGNIIGMINMSSDILIIKDNGRVYRLSGEFPNWVINEVGRNINCRSRNSYCSVVNNAFILGNSELQLITTTQEYGDMKANNIATKVATEIRELTNDARLVYLPPLNQIWIISGNERVLIFDCNFNSFFVRVFNACVVDVIAVNNDIYVLKKHSLCKLNEEMTDEGRKLSWKFQTKTTTSYNNLLLKRVRINITPYFVNRADIRFYIGGIRIEGSMPSSADCIYHDYSYLYKNKRELRLKKKTNVYRNSDCIYDNPEYIYGNRSALKGLECFKSDVRCVYRSNGIRASGKGGGGLFLLNSFNYDVAEV